LVGEEDPLGGFPRLSEDPGSEKMTVLKEGKILSMFRRRRVERIGSDLNCS
jgi:hypothetical protein